MIAAKYVLLFVSMVLLIGVLMVANKKNPLEVYHNKRSLPESGEPSSKNSLRKNAAFKHPIFVIQKHDASHLHYDFRLEIDGVLTSWAVPKGPSTNPSEKHLAVMTEDHPMAYATFEGVIPAGNYGAGVVMVWDIGSYHNIKKKNDKVVSMQECLEQGHVEVFLEGTVLQGAYALIRMHGQSKNWLLVKMNDEYIHKPKNPVTSVRKSALSGKTMTQLKKNN